MISAVFLCFVCVNFTAKNAKKICDTIFYGTKTTLNGAYSTLNRRYSTLRGFQNTSQYSKA